MELRQVVRYSGPTHQAVRELVAAELPRAAAAGFQAVRWARWDSHRRRPCLIVEYRWTPPDTLVRRFGLRSADVVDKQALDGGEMALAGYVLEEASWIRGVRVPQPGALVLVYRYDPATVGEPISPIPPTTDDPSDVWWVVRRHLRAVTVPDGPGWGPFLKQARRATLTLLGAPRSALAEVHPSRR